MEANLKDKTILFFDGECALCNFWVQFCLERDRKKSLFFAPLQGSTAQNLLPEELRQSIHTVVLWHEQKTLIKSTAIITALRKIDYSPDLLLFARLIPSTLRDGVYDFVARHRYRWFGKQETCPIPPEEYRSQLLN